VVCGKCKCECSIKNGTRQGKQCFLCKQCGFQFTGDYEFIQNERRAAITLCAYGFSMRKVGELMGYSHVTIINWVRDFERNRENMQQTHNWMDDYFMAHDELYSFLETRNNHVKLRKHFSNRKKKHPTKRALFSGSSTKGLLIE